MYKKLMCRHKTLLTFWILLTAFQANAQQEPIYRDSTKTTAQRVKDLLKRMTLEEKVGQMSMRSSYTIKGKPVACGVFSYPVTDVKTFARLTLAGQKYAREHFRLSIPAIQAAECLHGLLDFGATVFPQSIALGSTWNPELIKQMGDTIAVEASACGVNQALSPLFDIVRDPRYGRNEECYGEDPYLVSKMGVAFVTGMQGDPALTNEKLPPGKIICTAKHFAAYSDPEGGINLAPAQIGEREFRSMFLVPFKAAVQQANIYSIMPGYNAIDGIPSHANPYLLRTILRKEWGFRGYTFSDYEALAMLCNFQYVAADTAGAAVLGVNAGVDVEAPRPDVYPHLVALVRSGKVRASLIDSAVAHILTVKFKAGLFDRPLPDTANIPKRVHTPGHVALAERIAEESVILLKNEHQLLPLDSNKIKTLAVIGRNADQLEYGDYSCNDNRAGVTLLKGLKNLLGNKVNIRYAKGCSLTKADSSGFPEAIAAVKNSDAVVVVMGTRSSEDSENGDDEPFTCGEGYDVTNIDPQGMQRQLLQAIYKTGKPVILVLVHGRPESISWEKQNIPAILDAWYPGEQGGTAIANILFGKVNPSGHLTVSIPQSTGNIPVYYNHVFSNTGFYHFPGSPNEPGRDYVFSSPDPLFPFGFGLSYTTFAYSNLKVSQNTFTKNQQITVTVDITNTGTREGKEVVQLYLGNKVNSVTTPVKELKGFEKVDLQPNETKTVSFGINTNDIGIWNKDMKWVTEPGSFDVMIGRSAEDVVLTQRVTYE